MKAAIMRNPVSPFIKICCICSAQEAEQAIAAGASAIGLVSAMPSGPGIIDEKQIAEIASAIPPPIATFLLTSLQTAEAIAEQHTRCRTTVLQLADHLPLDELRKLRAWLPGIKLVQVIHVTGPGSVKEAITVSGYVDAILLDSGNPNAAVKQLGGTGRTHDWRLSRIISHSVRTPLFLAGGLTPDNVSHAISTVSPFGLDVCSGVRTDGRLDPQKLRAFFHNLSLPFTDRRRH